MTVTPCSSRPNVPLDAGRVLIMLSTVDRVSSVVILALANNAQRTGEPPASPQTLLHHVIAMRTAPHKRIGSVNREDG